ncbi:MAG: arginine--tRNA ligase, partial [Candidatus Peribacteria bacterium]|nr:arginine--tRNA ligase [Candidatus Peribacteria bacterium]
MSILLTHRRYFAQQALYLVSLNVNEFINPLDTLASELIVGIKNVFPTIQKTVIKIKLENPPSHIKADYAFSTFLISDLIGVNPLTVAEKIVENFSKNSLKLSKRIFAAGPYVNIELDKQIYQQEVLNHILSENNEFGTKSVKNPRAIIINYYSSNFSP